MNRPPRRRSALCASAALALALAAPAGTLRAQTSDAPEPPAIDGATPAQPSDATPGTETLAPGDADAPTLAPSRAFRDTTLAAPPPVGAEVDPNADLPYGAYQRGYYLTALHRAMQRLEEVPDDRAAMTLIGELYKEGLGVVQDIPRALDWYRLASERGDANATFALAMAAVEGRGRARDLDEARRLLERAAEAGHPRAAYNLALFLLGDGGGAARTRAAELLEAAAFAEIPAAQHALGVLLAEGIDGTPEPMRAVAWLSRAARNGETDAMVELGIALFNGDGTRPDEAAAAGWFRRAAFRGHPVAQNRLARLLVAGRGVETDLVEAASWHILAAARGVPDAWLDERLGRLPAEDVAQAEALARERAAFM